MIGSLKNLKSKINNQMKILQQFIFLALVLSINACKVTKDISVPEQPSNLQYRNAQTSDSSTIAVIPWNQFFVNKELQQLIDTTLANNYDMQIALKNREAAQLVVKQSRLGYLPTIGAQLSGTINRPSDNSLSGLSLNQFLGKSYVEDYTSSISLNWEADIWGKIKNQQSKSLAAFLQTEEARKLIQTDLVSTIAKGYYNLLMLDAQVLIAKKNILLNDSVLAILNLQYKAGQVTSLAVHQATAQRLAAIELVPQLEQAIAVEENRLSILSGVTPDKIKRSGSIYETVFTGNLSSGFPSALLANRPDVKAKELDLVIANANTGISKAALYPSLAIGVNGGVNAFVASNWFNIPASLFATSVASLTQPIFQQGKLKTQYKISTVEREKKVIAFRQSVLHAVGEVSDVLVKVEKLQEQHNIAQARVNELQLSIGNAKMLFTNGMVNYLEVIVAQENVLQGELSLASLQKDKATAIIDLYRSLGGGWR